MLRIHKSGDPEVQGLRIPRPPNLKASEFQALKIRGPPNRRASEFQALKIPSPPNSNAAEFDALKILKSPNSKPSEFQALRIPMLSNSKPSQSQGLRISRAPNSKPSESQGFRIPSLLISMLSNPTLPNFYFTTLRAEGKNTWQHSQFKTVSHHLQHSSQAHSSVTNYWTTGFSNTEVAQH